MTTNNKLKIRKPIKRTNSINSGNNNTDKRTNKEKNGSKKVRIASALLDKKRGKKDIARKARQTTFLNCYYDTFDIGKACEAAGVTRRTFYYWMEISKFKETFEEITEKRKDWIENKLFEKVEKGDTACTIFLAKCQLRSRGYAPDNVLGKLELNTSVNLFLDEKHRQSVIEASKITPETLHDCPGKEKLLQIMAENQQNSA